MTPAVHRNLALTVYTRVGRRGHTANRTTVEGRRSLSTYTDCRWATYIYIYVYIYMYSIYIYMRERKRRAQLATTRAWLTTIYCACRARRKFTGALLDARETLCVVWWLCGMRSRPHRRLPESSARACVSPACLLVPIPPPCASVWCRQYTRLIESTSDGGNVT